MKKKRKKTVIDESYGFAFTRWNADKFSDTTKKILKKCFDVKEIADQFNNQLVPKKWFDWKKVFGKLTDEQISIEGAGVKGGCVAIITFKTEISGEDFDKLIYGDSEEKKYGGLIYNQNLKKTLHKAGINEISTSAEDADLDGASSSNDDEDADIDDVSAPKGEDADIDAESVNQKLINAYKNIIFEQSGSLNLEVVFEMNVIMKPHYQKLANEQKEGAAAGGDEAEIKGKDFVNPNYVTEFSGGGEGADGGIFLKFNDVKSPSIGKVIINPKRTMDMDVKPKVSFLDNMKNLWNDTMKNPPNDFGIVGVAAKRQIKQAFKSITNNFEVVQKQKIKIDIGSGYIYTKNLKDAKEKSDNTNRRTAALTDDAYQQDIIANIEEIFTDPYSVEVEVDPDKGQYVTVYIRRDDVDLLIIDFKYGRP